MASKKSKPGYDGKIAGLYDLEDTIGRGHFAVVKLARHVFTGEKVAVKVIDKTKLDEISKSHLFQEVRCMKLVQHPNVVRLYEVIDTQTKLYLILELGDGGDMYDYIMKHTGGLEEKLAKRYFRQIVEAISYCHKLHVVHRDLKPENVVFFEKLGLVKLTDFGFSNMFAPGKKLETSCGSLAYSAPEILLGDSYDAPAVDVWSLGVILFMLVVGTPPFQEANDSETLTMIMDCKYHVPPHVSESCQNLIGRMLQREPSKRATLQQIMDHPWLTDGDIMSITTFLPLITREMISEEDQSYVIQKMVEGKIAAREEILHSLEKNSYDHITATYYLLIERRLRKHQQYDLQQSVSSGSLRKQSTPSRPSKPNLEPLMLSPRVQNLGSEHADSNTSQYVQSLVSPPGTHPSTSSVNSKQAHASSYIMDSNLLLPPGPVPRKCSLITEESLDEYDDDEDDDYYYNVDPAVMKPVKSLESLDELPSTSNHGFTSADLSPTSAASLDLTNPRRPLKSVCSSPQLLNQIHEENESEDEDFVPLKLSTPRRFTGHNGHRENSSASPEILRKYEQRKKRRGAGSRGASCSSSDASDTDDTEGRSRKDKLRHKFVHRRDSSDHSSDTDGPGSNLGGGGHLGDNGGSTSRGSQHRSGGNNGNSKKGGGSGGGCNESSNKGSDGKSHSMNTCDSHSAAIDVQNHRNAKHHSPIAKGSLTDSSLKLLTRKLTDISSGVGALLNDCRGSECDEDSPRSKPASGSPSESGFSLGSVTLLPRNNRSASVRSNGSGKIRYDLTNGFSAGKDFDGNLQGQQPFVVIPSAVQYLGQSSDCETSICGHGLSLEFSEISHYYTDSVGFSAKCPNRSGQRKSLDRAANGLHSSSCKPSTSNMSVVPVKSKCCSVV